jgi:hypothetical protein
MSNVQRYSGLSSSLIVVKSVQSVDCFGNQTSVTELGVVNSTGADIVIPAGSTLYVTVVPGTSSVKEDGDAKTRTSRGTDVRVWTPKAKDAAATIPAADVPF